jgi:tetratricopeptide (TPR) repeat protein
VNDTEALERALAISTRNPLLLQAAQAMLAKDLPSAERLLRSILYERPNDIAAIRMMAEIAGRLGRYADAEKLLRRAIELAPAFTAARANLATALYRQSRTAEALEILEALLGQEPGNPSFQNLKAAALNRLGGYEEAIGLYEQVLAKAPDQPKVWMSYGHALKTVGRQQDGVAAYRRALALAPAMGEVWWSLANLKTVPFSDEDVAAMESALGGDLKVEDRFHLHFALGKALDERSDPAGAFAHYAEANRLRHAMMGYDADEVTNLVRRSKRLYSRDFFAAREGFGSPAPDPIFILGMPRSGSTLIEQILASHPSVEGTMELPDLPVLAGRLGKWRGGDEGEARYPESVAGLDAAACAALGEEYLDRTRIQRKTGRPFFIDKLPNNWIHTGLIHLILPRAKIVDARRHPLDCCFSNFKQHYARGQGFSYSLDDMGRYYADYVELMAHFDSVLPGRVHRVVHERLVENPEGEVRRLLAALGLDFDPACLRFHENKRAVRTASSEQVRRPITREGIGQWKPFEPWLGPLEAALGPVLVAWPDAPAEWQ